MKNAISARALLCALTAVGGLAASGVAHAQLDCIVPTREEGFDGRAPGAQALRRAALAAAEITQRNAVFMAGNKPVRVRTSIAYFGEQWLSASVITTAYNEKAWLKGDCKVSGFADRGGGLADGQIAIYINDPEASLAGRLGDAELSASRAPQRIGTHAGFPVYAPGADARNPRVLLTANGYLPWAPVTVAEMLAWRERDLVKREAEFAQMQRPPPGGEFDEKKIDEIYRSMKPMDPAGAEQARAKMLAQLAKMREQAPKQLATASASIAKQRSAFEAYRASLSPAQLAAPGTMSTATTRDGAIRVDDPAGEPLARVDPGYAKRDRNRIHVIAVSIAPQPKTDPEYAWQQASYDALDFAALAGLLGDQGTAQKRGVGAGSVP